PCAAPPRGHRSKHRLARQGTPGTRGGATHMVTAAQKQSFEETGYLVVEGVLQGELLEGVRREAAALSASEAPDVGRRVWHERALFRRRAFREVLAIPALIEAARALLGDDVQLLAIDLLLVRPGQGGIGWHRDVTFICNKTLSINTGIYLTD